MSKIIPIWVADYIGLEFADNGRGPDKFDCWGLLRKLYADRYGIEIPDFSDRYTNTGDAQGIAKIYDEHHSQWHKLGPGEEKEGDVIMLRLGTLPRHVGMVVAPGIMLHTEDGKDSVVERYDSQVWKNRTIGIYRHRERL